MNALETGVIFPERNLAIAVKNHKNDHTPNLSNTTLGNTSYGEDSKERSTHLNKDDYSQTVYLLKTRNNPNAHPWERG